MNDLRDYKLDLPFPIMSKTLVLLIQFFVILRGPLFHLAMRMAALDIGTGLVVFTESVSHRLAAGELTNHINCCPGYHNNCLSSLLIISQYHSWHNKLLKIVTYTGMHCFTVYKEVWQLTVILLIYIN